MCECNIYIEYIYYSNLIWNYYGGGGIMKASVSNLARQIFSEIIMLFHVISLVSSATIYLPIKTTTKIIIIII